ncbi:hypothetical protein Cni_G16023 [Canna indica]|uniref:Uncharacterized protein n=1 Tax=Canna indica TaxID=4628 RepID=A0AAQ3KI04_9LILI|nr:hypothetical protein Cni_G16023 [Canna indica]
MDYLYMNSDSGDKGENGLRRVREEGEESIRKHERSEQRIDGAEAEQGDGGRVRGAEEGGEEVGVEDGEEGGAVAVRAVRRGGAPLRAGGLRQEGAAGVRAERGGRPGGGAARPRQLHRGQVHHRLQRREPQQLQRHVKDLRL